jgi:hypothetical protein
MLNTTDINCEAFPLFSLTIINPGTMVRVPIARPDHHYVDTNEQENTDFSVEFERVMQWVVDGQELEDTQWH